jgi:hypothetical protein
VCPTGWSAFERLLHPSQNVKRGWRVLSVKFSVGGGEGSTEYGGPIR